MRFTVILSLVFVTLVATERPSPAADGALEKGDAQSRFLVGVEAFQKKKFDDAGAAFATLTQAEGDTPLLLFNLGLVKNQTGKPGFALGLWRKALAADPFYHPAQNAIAWVQPKLEHPEITHEVELWESLRSYALVPMTLEAYVMGAAALLLLSGWLTFRYLGQRRNARLDEKPMPGIPFAAATSGLLFVFFAVLSLAKTVDSRTLRGTVTEKKIEARSSPDANSTSLFELFEGLEVIVRRTEKIGDSTWVQVTYPGAATGWIPKAALFTYDDPAAGA